MASLPAQTEPSLDVLIGWLQSFKAPHDTRYTKALLVTLQQHERTVSERDTAQTICGEAYQAVGALAHYIGLFDHPDIIRLMDNLAYHDDPPHETLLPWPKEDIPNIRQQHERLQDELRGAHIDRDIYKARVKQLDDECQRFMREVAFLRQQHERLETRPDCGEIVERVAAAMWEHNHDGAWPDDAEPVALNIYRGDAAIAINVICRALLVPQPGCVNPGPLPNTDTASDKPEDAERAE